MCQYSGALERKWNRQFTRPIFPAGTKNLVWEQRLGGLRAAKKTDQECPVAVWPLIDSENQAIKSLRRAKSSDQADFLLTTHFDHGRKRLNRRHTSDCPLSLTTQSKVFIFTTVYYKSPPPPSCSIWGDGGGGGTGKHGNGNGNRHGKGTAKMKSKFWICL